MKLTRCFKNFLVALLMLFLYGIVGKIDYESELNYQEESCNMVENGYWPEQHCKK